MPLPPIPEPVRALMHSVGMKELAQDLSVSKHALVGYDLTWLKADRVSFEECDLSKSDFSHANLMDCNFSRATAIRAVWDGAYLWQCDLREARLDGSVFQTSSIVSSWFSRARLFRAAFERSTLDDVAFNDAALPDTEFHACELTDCDFRSAILDGVTFNDCLVTGTTFTNADLTRLTVSGSSFRSCDFTGSRADWAVLRTAATFDGCSGLVTE